jgi:glutamate racemase
MPVIRVVDPGATAAVAARPGGSHLVLATEATVRLGAYRRSILRRDPSAQVRELACELLVAVAEEGWRDGPIAESIVRRYIDEMQDSAYKPDSVILGCTHFPILRDAIASAFDDDVVIVDSASTTAEVAREQLQELGLVSSRQRPGSLTLLATDGALRFARVGGQFLGTDLAAEDITVVDL